MADLTDDERADLAREQEFEDCEGTFGGWDGYHVEDAVSFARMFRRQRNELRERLMKEPR